MSCRCTCTVFFLYLYLYFYCVCVSSLFGFLVYLHLLRSCMMDRFPLTGLSNTSLLIRYLLAAPTHESFQVLFQVQLPLLQGFPAHTNRYAKSVKISTSTIFVKKISTKNSVITFKIDIQSPKVSTSFKICASAQPNS